MNRRCSNLFNNKQLVNNTVTCTHVRAGYSHPQYNIYALSYKGITKLMAILKIQLFSSFIANSATLLEFKYDLAGTLESFACSSQSAVLLLL